MTTGRANHNKHSKEEESVFNELHTSNLFMLPLWVQAKVKTTLESNYTHLSHLKAKTIPHLWQVHMAIRLRSAALRVTFITRMSAVGSDNTPIALKPTQDTSSFPIMPEASTFLPSSVTYFPNPKLLPEWPDILFPSSPHTHQLGCS